MEPRTSIKSYKRHQYSGRRRSRNRIRGQMKRYHGEDKSRNEVWCNKKMKTDDSVPSTIDNTLILAPSTSSSTEEKHEELKKELKRKKARERQRAYYHRQKVLKEEKETKKVPKTNAERQKAYRQRNAGKLKKRKSCKSEENVGQSRAVENIENFMLQGNHFLSQHLDIYEQRNECITPEVILHRNTGIPDDGIKQEVLETSSIKEEPADDEGAFDNEVVPEEMVMTIDQSCCSDDHYNERENFVAIKQEVPEYCSIEVNCADEGALDNEMLKCDITMEYGASYYSDQNFVAIKCEPPDDSIKVECADEGGSDNVILQEYMAIEYDASCYSDGQYNLSGTKKIKREVDSDDEYISYRTTKKKKESSVQNTATTKRRSKLTLAD